MNNERKEGRKEESKESREGQQNDADILEKKKKESIPGGRKDERKKMRKMISLVR